MITSRSIFWHRRDLRIEDNIGLCEASKNSKNLIGVYVLDPNLLNLNRTTSEAKNWFLGESLLELQKNWERRGSRLLILNGDPIKLISKLADLIQAECIYWNDNIEPYEINRDKIITEKLSKDKRKIYTFLDQLIVNPANIKTNNYEPYKVYGPFYRKWIDIINQTNIANRNSIQISRTSGKIQGLDEKELSLIKNSDLNYCITNETKPIYDLLSLNRFKDTNLCPCKPGESESKKQLNFFINSGIINSYNQARDIPSLESTSNLSAALSLGTISCRAVWNGAQQSKNLATNEYQTNAIDTWIKELAWREFYQNALINFPELEKGPYREKWLNFPWQNNSDWFEAWANGLTGIPIVDAAMRQLKDSGWMHNRCRMIVASFLVKDLLIDWRWGELFFMKSLVDGDLASNNGGWQWSASSGMDPKPMRIFNPFRQASKFDEDGNYIRKWVPELSHISTPNLLSGEIISAERNSYPKPIINHKIQTSIFKELYSSIK
ncbi:cryptochrome/photolyase family protein [Prochlorococcus marinus]|uniref:cryptochrome/photolyase family protein n=1 Tax=Prochlorococcus marinus TaxID=1219 RepID=UPI0022B38378|nr:FAD-binding domain-containing protein [Prochlorococcus marinus]